MDDFRGSFNALVKGDSGRNVAGPQAALPSSINIDHYCIACCSNEKLDFEILVSLFNSNRRKPFLERMFTPHALNREIRRERRFAITERIAGSNVIPEELYDLQRRGTAASSATSSSSTPSAYLKSNGSWGRAETTCLGKSLEERKRWEDKQFEKISKQSAELETLCKHQATQDRERMALKEQQRKLEQDLHERIERELTKSEDEFNRKYSKLSDSYSQLLEAHSKLESEFDRLSEIDRRSRSATSFSRGSVESAVTARSSSDFQDSASCRLRTFTGETWRSEAETNTELGDAAVADAPKRRPARFEHLTPRARPARFDAQRDGHLGVASLDVCVDVMDASSLASRRVCRPRSHRHPDGDSAFLAPTALTPMSASSQEACLPEMPLIDVRPRAVLGDMDAPDESEPPLYSV